MQPASPNRTAFVIVILALLGTGFLLWQNRGTPGVKPIDLKSSEAFVPPVYNQGESLTALIRPLYLEAASGGRAALSAEQKQTVADFKKKILSRVASHESLTGQEKMVLAISVSTIKKPAIGALLVADQSVFQFSDDELKEITRALEQ